MLMHCYSAYPPIGGTGRHHCMCMLKEKEDKKYCVLNCACAVCLQSLRIGKDYLVVIHVYNFDSLLGCSCPRCRMTAFGAYLRETLRRHQHPGTAHIIPLWPAAMMAAIRQAPRDRNDGLWVATRPAKLVVRRLAMALILVSTEKGLLLLTMQRKLRIFRDALNTCVAYNYTKYNERH